jgi:hypothetical protein
MSAPDKFLTDAAMAIPKEAAAALGASVRRASDLLNEAAQGLGLVLDAHNCPLVQALTANVLAEMSGGMYARAAWVAAATGAERKDAMELIQSAFLKGKEEALDTMMAARRAAQGETIQ